MRYLEKQRSLATPPFLVPKVIAHRGACAYAPENTLSAFHAAADMGAEWVELDAKLTKDGTVIVFHDKDLVRCTGAEGLVADTDWDTIRELDAGSWFGESFIGERIPTLEEALNVILERGMGVNIEIKPCPGREIETAETALDVATRIWPDDGAPPLISSFQHPSLEISREMIPDWPIALEVYEHLANWKELMEYLGCAALSIDGNNVTPEQVREYASLRKQVIAYTINDPEKALELFDWGVNSVFTDAPDILLEALGDAA